MYEVTEETAEAMNGQMENLQRLGMSVGQRSGAAEAGWQMKVELCE